MTPPPPPPIRSNLPPSLPGAEPGKTFRTLAQFSWISIPFSLALNIYLSTTGGSREAALARSIVAGFLMLGGLVSGIVALCAIPKYGRKGLLWPALCGVVSWLLLIALAIPVMVLVRKKAAEAKVLAVPAVVLEPAQHRRSSDRFEDKELGYSFDLPAGYEPVPAASKPAQFRHVFLKQGVGESHSVIMIKELKGMLLANSHLQEKDLPAGTKATLMRFSWRGLSVDAFRVVEQTPSEDYVTFNIQIPLKGHPLQIGFGGPGSNEALLKAQAEQTLATLEGEVNQ